MVIDITSVEPALNVEATELVARQLRVHSKEAKSLKKGGARNVVVLRALLEQIRMVGSVIGLRIVVCCVDTYMSTLP